MEKMKPAVDSPAAAPETTGPSTVTETEDEVRFRKLEEEKDNYKKAFLKEKSKDRSGDSDEEDERIQQKVDEAIANSRLAEITQEQDAIIHKALKENRELKLAQLNKITTAPPAAMGSHSESQPVRDTLITPEQAAYFKAQNWSDKDIERYKKNLQKNSR